MRIILCATNDIATDSRVKRIALSVMNLPAGVMLFGISLPTSLPLPAYPFGTHRISMVFKKGPLFYAEFNVRLFFSLLFAKADLLVANDLDSRVFHEPAQLFAAKCLVFRHPESPGRHNFPQFRRIFRWMDDEMGNASR